MIIKINDNNNNYGQWRHQMSLVSKLTCAINQFHIRSQLMSSILKSEPVHVCLSLTVFVGPVNQPVS